MTMAEVVVEARSDDEETAWSMPRECEQAREHSMWSSKIGGSDKDEMKKYYERWVRMSCRLSFAFE